jgi:hypothetical protein
MSALHGVLSNLDRGSGRTTLQTGARTQQGQRCAICRFCGSALENTFVDLGMSPLANSYVKPDRLNLEEPFYPLRVLICDSCLLVQLEVFETPEHIFADYAYFSSYSESWLRHAKTYVDQVTPRFALGPKSQVVEIASNDGYLLQYFVEKGIPVLGVEPAANVAKAAVRKGVPELIRHAEGLLEDAPRPGRKRRLTAETSPLSPALHPDGCFLAESGVDAIAAVRSLEWTLACDHQKDN